MTILIGLILMPLSVTAATKVVIIIDLSQSARSSFSQYRSAIRRMLEQNPINIGDTFTIMGITDDSFGKRILLLDDSIEPIPPPGKELVLKDCSSLPKGSFSYDSCLSTNKKAKADWANEQNRLTGEHFRKERQRLLSRWDKNTASPSGTSTDVFGALKYAEHLFGNWEGQKELFLFSDMRHNTRGLDISHKVRMDSEFLKEIRRQQLIPKLKNVSITIKGVLTEGRDPAYFESLNQFWSKIFSESGGNLRDFSIE